MTDLVRQEVAANTSTLVVKVGSRVLTREDGLLDEERLSALAEELAQITDAGRQVALVSSGAVAAGMGRLGLSRRPRNLAQLQAASAVGQSRLVEAYDRALASHNRHAALVLLTVDDLNHRTRYLTVRIAILALFQCGAVPIINENDCVSVDELQISFGDNDHLAAMVTNLLRAQLLVLLSDVEGLYDRDPSDPDRQRIATVERMDESTQALALDRKTGLSKGGMASKLAAANIATTAGENVIIASGRRHGVLSEILAGEDVGTLFLPQGQTVKSRKRWIGFAVQPRGSITVDAGAVEAVTQKGRSLLAAGIASVEGSFDKGDLLRLCGPDGKEFARGLTNYTAGEVTRICGLKSEQIATELGHCPYDEVVHRDNMTVTNGG